MLKKLIALSLLITITQIAFAQSTLSGIVKDSKGEAIIGASIIVKELSKGNVSQLDGTYSITNLQPGSYTIQAVCLTYKEVIIGNYKISKGNNTLDFTLQEDANILDEVVVKGIKRQGSELTTINTVKNATAVISAVSSTDISKSPDKNAAEVVKRVPGISIVDDRFIVVRGLPQRYNNVWLNNAGIPASEPDSKSFSFDMLPSSQIENILIVKSPSPELPAEFSGGFLMIQSKGIPDKNKLLMGYAAAYNNSSTFKSLKTISKSNWNIKEKTAIPDQKASINIENSRQTKKGNLIGIAAGAEYSYNARLIEGMTNCRYGVYNNVEDKSEYLYKYKDDSYTIFQRIGAQLNTTYLREKAKYSFRNIFNKTYTNRYTQRDGWQNISSLYNQEKYEYLTSSRTIYSGQLSGEHLLKNDLLNWNVSYSFAGKQDPDRRIINRQENTYYGDRYFGLMGIDQNEITRDNNKLNENIFTAGVDYKTFTGKNPEKQAIELNMGLYAQYRNRKYDVSSYTYRFNANNLPDDFIYRDPVTEILINSNLSDDKMYLYNDTDNRDSYKGDETISAAYIKGLIPLGKLKINAGARFEARSMNLNSYTSINGNNTKKNTYNNYNVFPSVNISYGFNNKHILKFAYGISTNRQEFRELSSSVYYDFTLFSDVKGNPDLKAAIVQNFDLRYELYSAPKEYVTLAVFYKHFKNPIEWTYLDAGGSYTYTFENANAANNYGVELDIKKNLGFMALKNLTLGLNASLIKSKVKFDKSTSLEKDRPMQGQSPYLINASLYYDCNKAGLQLGVLYNRIGKRIVGIGRVDTSAGSSINNDVPDTYELPRNALDFVVSKTIGKKITIKANAKDILNESIIFAQYPKFYNNEGNIVERKQISKKFKQGVTYSLSIQLTF